MTLLKSAVLCVWFALGVTGTASAQALDGAALYKRTCAQCHDSGVNRAPARDAFLVMTPDHVLAAMETGGMVTMANGRSVDERRASCNRSNTR